MTTKKAGRKTWERPAMVRMDAADAELMAMFTVNDAFIGMMNVMGS